MIRWRTGWLAGAAILAGLLAVWVVPASGAGSASLAISDVSANEGQAGTTNFAFTVSLSGNPRANVTVSYATVSGTATSPGDYASASGTLTLSRRQRSATVNVSVVGDTVNEPNEQFSVQLSNASGASISRAVGVATILNDDAPPPPPSDPVIVAAGDIACDPASSSYNGGQGTASECRQLATSNLFAGASDAAVLTLGDNQ